MNPENLCHILVDCKSAGTLLDFGPIPTCVCSGGSEKSKEKSHLLIESCPDFRQSRPRPGQGLKTFVPGASPAEVLVQTADADLEHQQ